MCQVKRKKIMITAQTKINILIVEATAFNESQKFSASEVQIENVLICQSDQELDDDDINKEYLNMNYADKLNILIAVLHSDKQKNKVFSSTLEKKKKVIEEQV